MFNWRDLIVFLAGFEFFHTLSHILIIYFVKLPWKMGYANLTVTNHLNIWAIIINGLITIGLLCWAAYLGRKSKF